MERAHFHFLGGTLACSRRSGSGWGVAGLVARITCLSEVAADAHVLPGFGSMRLYRKPLHIGDGVRATGAKRLDVINLPAGACAAP